jgi:hypothetical protein
MARFQRSPARAFEPDDKQPRGVDSIADFDDGVRF